VAFSFLSRHLSGLVLLEKMVERPEPFHARAFPLPKRGTNADHGVKTANDLQRNPYLRYPLSSTPSLENPMRIRSLIALSALASFVACGDDDPAAVPSEDSGTADTDSGVDTGADTTPDVGSVCGEATECLRLSDCGDAGLTTPSCVEGCCVEGTPVDPPDPVAECGEVTFQGECEGAVVRWCQDGALQEIDCAGFYEGTVGTCEFFTEEFGYYCAAPEGFACFGEGTAFCGGEGDSGCLVSDLTVATGSACSGFESDCAPPEDAEAEFAGYCEGDIAVWSCNVNQPTGFDCAAMGGACDAGTCVNLQPEATCFDGLLECAPGLDCVGEADQPGACEGELADPTCEDGVMNGDEGGVDCGGSCDDACDVEPTCEDGEMNGDEDGVDCGGSCDDACVPADPTCDDEEQNGTESSVDCGGDECAACVDGETCGVAGDCESGVCSADDGLCAAPTCEDGVQNGAEEGIDCGGETCIACDV
jgi:hypothetical protein